MVMPVRHYIILNVLKTDITVSIMEATKKVPHLLCFSLKIVKTYFDNVFLLPQLSGLKEPYFLPNVATNLLKNYEF